MVDLKALGEISITVDCDVLNADGGTRCAAITGAWIALRLALEKLVREGTLPAVPLKGQVAAISCGLTETGAVLDLDEAQFNTLMRLARTGTAELFHIQTVTVNEALAS